MARIWYPDSLPSGLSAAAERKLNSYVEKNGFTRIAKDFTRNGYVFVGEREEPEGFLVFWACNDFFRLLKMNKFSHQLNRAKLAIADAEKELGGKKNH